MVGPRDVQNDLLPQLEAEALKLGLVLNRGKCAVLVLAEGMDLPEEFLPSVSRVSGAACLAFLGSPVCGVASCHDWADQHVGKPLSLALDWLLSLGEPRAASVISGSASPPARRIGSCCPHGHQSGGAGRVNNTTNPPGLGRNFMDRCF